MTKNAGNNTLRSSVLALTAGILAAAAVFAPNVLGYSHSAQCATYVSGQTCYGGDGFHSNIEADTSLGIGHNAAEVCAKASTAAGTVKGGSGCNANYYLRASCLAASPDSGAYGYWGGNYGGSYRTVSVYNYAGSDRVYC